MRFPEMEVSLPGWVGELVEGFGTVYPAPEDRMRLVVELSRSNVHYGTGGPFGAAIFERESGRLLAPGVNLVTSANCSVLHAETVAIMVAQQMVGAFDLGGTEQPPYELVASTEPCSMCLGATFWSGVRSLSCGARTEDAEKIGFDAGLKLENWASSFEERGIPVTRDVLRTEAAAVLQEYVALGGEIYNGPRED